MFFSTLRGVESYKAQDYTVKEQTKQVERIRTAEGAHQQKFTATISTLVFAVSVN